MSIRFRPLSAIAMVVTSAFAAIEGCSATPPSEDDVASQQSQALISVGSQNSPVAFSGNHETSVTYVKGMGGPVGGIAPGRWVMATNNFDTFSGLNWWSWGYSTDGNGNSWTFANQSSGTAFGCPGGACPGTPAPSDGTNFKGWAGDPSISAVTDPTWSASDKRVVAANIAYNNSGGNDVLVALSEDGGQTWGNVQWVDTPTSSGNTDMPFVFSNPNSPYDTYVSWKAGNTGYMRKIKYGVSPATFNPGPVLTIPKTATDNYVNRFNFDFGKLPSGCASGGEGIYVVYTNDTARCNRSGTREATGTINWNLTVYDTVNQVWYGPWQLANDPGYFNCGGFPLSNAYTTSMDPHIAVDSASSTSSQFWMVHDNSTPKGIRARVESGVLVCSNGSVTPNTSTIWTDPDPCTGGCTLPDGGVQINDDWLPGIAIHRNGSTPRVAWYWYGTRDQNNNSAALYMSYVEGGGAINGPTQITSSAFPAQGSSTWPVGGLDTWDYQTLASSWANKSFLTLWAGDERATKVEAWNGGFETNDYTGWSTGGAAHTITTSDKNSGTYSAMLGATTPTNGDSTAAQTFTAPAFATSLQVWYKMTCPDTVVYDWATVTLLDNTTLTQTTILPKTCVTSSSWTSVNASIVAGHSYTITLTSHDDNFGADPSYTLFDDLVFGAPAGTTTINTNIAK